jgi:HD-GYP domain-containing protein (c-di-GMP phosphodiesterase class II)
MTLRGAWTFDQALTLDEALKVLKAMIRSDLRFDPDLVAKIDDLLRAQPDETVTQELLQGLIDVQRLLFLHLSPRQAVPASLKAVRWARRLGDKASLARALRHRGSIAANIYDLSTAVEATLEALKLGLEIRDLNCVGACYLNLGISMRRIGRFQAAMACNEASIKSYEMEGYSESLAHAMNAMVDQHMKSGNWREALEACRHAQKILENIKPNNDLSAINSADHACILMNEVTVHLHLSEFDAARDVIDRLSLVAEPAPSERVAAYLRFAKAVYAGFAGLTDEAIQELKKFRDLPEMRDEALQYLTAIYERRGEPEKALEVTRELLEGMRAARREITATDLADLSVFTTSEDDDVIRNLVSRAASFEQVIGRIGDKFRAKLAYLFELAVSAELQEEGIEYVGEHIYRVGSLCALLAAEAGCQEEMCWLAEVAGRSHDVGKTSVPSLIILKTEPLSEGERELLKSHAEDGAALIAQLAEPRLVQVVAAVRHHHERWDGSGYPSKLKGEEIPLLARIVAICDSFDAMTHGRAFRSARSVSASLAEIERCAGSQYDSRLAGLFVNLARRLRREHGELDEYLGESGRRTRWAKSHPELMRLLQEHQTTL